MAISIPLIGAGVIGRMPYGFFPAVAPAPVVGQADAVDPRFTTGFDELFDQATTGHSLTVSGHDGGEWTVKLYRFDLDQAIAANQSVPGGVIASSFSPSASLTLAVTPAGAQTAPVPVLTTRWKDAGSGIVTIRATAAGLAATVAAMPANSRVGYRLVLTIGTSSGPMVGLDWPLTVYI